MPRLIFHYIIVVENGWAAAKRSIASSYFIKGLPGGRFLVYRSWCYHIQEKSE